MAPLDGELFALFPLDNYTITNRDLLEAFKGIAYYQEAPSAPLRRVNFGALDVEELGSVYESVLDYQPQIDHSAGFPRFELAPGTERRSTGSYYTPPNLVAELIHATLEPVLGERLKGAATAADKERALLSIRVLDLACGSGHFLLAAARCLGKELAKIRSGEEEPSPERLREAIRDVIRQLLYGVDKNPLAVELCRVALWLDAHAQGKPLAFLDHHIRCGDSLGGVLDPAVLKEGIPEPAFAPTSGDDRKIAHSLQRRNKSEQAGQHDLLLANDVQIGPAFKAMSAELATSDDTLAQLRQKAAAWQSWQKKVNRARTACDLYVAAFFQPLTATNRQPITTAVSWHYLETRTADEQSLRMASACAEEHRSFHWPLEFPEVFMASDAASAATAAGFDVILGNPPYMGGLKISGNLGEKYRKWLKFAYEPFFGQADLCAAFFRRAYSLLRPGGRLGLLATNTIGEGATRKCGLAAILNQGGVITFARRFIKWPGAANVEVNSVVVCKSDVQSLAMRRKAYLDDKPVPFISSRLDDDPEVEPARLKRKEGRAFQGDTVYGMGFVLELQEAEALLAQHPRHADCLFPYLSGKELNSDPEQRPRPLGDLFS